MTVPHPSVSSDEEPLPGGDPRPWLSALADGRPEALEPALRHWRDGDDAQRTWHAYHVIGDVLRSEELAQPAARDRALLDRVRRRLDAEPAILAPTAGPSAASTRRPAALAALRWAAPAGLAASLVMGSVWMLSPRGDAERAPAVAVRQPGEGGVGVAGPSGGTFAGVASPAAPAVAAAAAVAADGVIRDPRLEEFLRAHQAARGGWAQPGGGQRRVETWAVSSAPVPVRRTP